MNIFKKYVSIEVLKFLKISYILRYIITNKTFI